MPQYLVPISDYDLDGDWSPSSGAILYTMVDEISADDADWIDAHVGPSIIPRIRFKLSTGVDPLLSTGHTIRLRARREGLIAVDLLAKIYQGGTLKASQTFALDTSFGEFTYTFAGVEADSITNYADLYLELACDEVHDAAPVVKVSMARFEIPLAGFTHLDVSGGGMVNAAQQSGFYLVLSGAGFQRLAGTESTGALILDTGAGLKVSS